MLTPEDIKSRQFLHSLRGYDKDEVDAFLDEVAEEFGALLDGVPVSDAPRSVEEPAQETAPEPVAEAEPASFKPDFAAIGAETQRILEAAQEAADKIREKASEDADTIKSQRIGEAEEKVAGLEAEAASINQQIADLTARREELAGRLRQARETVDLALLEIEPPAPDTPGDASNSVLAASDEDADDDEAAPQPAAESVKAESVEAQPVKAESVKAESVKAEPVKAEDADDAADEPADEAADGGEGDDAEAAADEDAS